MLSRAGLLYGSIPNVIPHGFIRWLTGDIQKSFLQARGFKRKFDGVEWSALAR